MSLEEFFNMGGYAVYVWSSYGIALLVLLANVIAPLRQRRKLLDGIARATKRQERRNA
jgi:heme exporter protein D